MKSACLTGIRKVELLDMPVPEVKGSRILVRVKSCSLCGSDVHYYRDGEIGDAACVYPHHIGHEPAGIVEKVFDESVFKVGDRVAIEPGLSCGECEFCKSGRVNICPHVKFLASPGIPGAFQEYLALDESQLEKMPDSMSFDEGAMLEPLGIAYHAVFNLAKIQPGETVAVFGSGAIGMLTLQLAKLAGCGTAFISDPLDYRLAFAKKHAGADFTVNPGKTDALKFIKEKTDSRGVDVAFDAAGTQQSLEQCFESAAIGGRVYLTGIPEVDRITYNPHSMRRKELLIQNVRRSNRTLDVSMKLVAEGKINLKPYISHRFPLEKIGEAMKMADTYSDGIIRAIINP